MNKKTLIALVLLTIAALTYYFLNKKPLGINYKDIADFSIDDTAHIDKIFIADRQGKTIELDKIGAKNWIINKNKLADFSKVELLLYTVKNMKVLRPVPASEHNTAVGDLATLGIKAQFYINGELFKTFYVGSGTQEQNGTYMLIEGSSKPYAVHIPGFFGFLTPRFISDSLVWRDRTVFNFLPNQIKSIEVKYTNDTKGFFIDNTNLQNPQILYLNQQPKPITDKQFLKFYIASFKNLNFDGYDENQSQNLIDSVLKTNIIASLKIVDLNGKEHHLKLYNKAIDKHTKNIVDETTGKELAYDSERYWAFFNNDKSLMLVQHYNFGKVLKLIDDFK